MILIALGANLPGLDGDPPIETCRKAVRAVARLPGLQLIKTSGWWLSAPVPPSGQPDYINGVAGFEGMVDPALLINHLQAIELSFGRVRGRSNDSRTLDLDIIAIGDMIRRGPDPILPHPRAHLRAFVLAPLKEIFPEWVHPLLGESVSGLLKGISAQSCQRLPDELQGSSISNTHAQSPEE